MRALLRLYGAGLRAHGLHLAPQLAALGEQRVQMVLDCQFLFALVWSVGGSLATETDALRFDTFLRARLQARLYLSPILKLKGPY